MGPIPMQLLQSETTSLSELKQYIKRVTGTAVTCVACVRIYLSLLKKDYL